MTSNLPAAQIEHSSKEDGEVVSVSLTHSSGLDIKDLMSRFPPDDLSAMQLSSLDGDYVIQPQDSDQVSGQRRAVVCICRRKSAAHGSIVVASSVFAPHAFWSYLSWKAHLQPAV